MWWKIMPCSKRKGKIWQLMGWWVVHMQPFSLLILCSINLFPNALFFMLELDCIFLK
jgi:hypothetical protein